MVCWCRPGVTSSFEEVSAFVVRLADSVVIGHGVLLCFLLEVCAGVVSNEGFIVVERLGQSSLSN